MNQAVIYTKMTCHYCMQLKQFLAMQQIPYHEVDVTNRPDILQQVAGMTGAMSVPQLFLNGQIVVGFRPEEIMKALQTREHLWGWG